MNAQTAPLSTILSDSDLDFLVTLANKLTTQDTAATRKPVIYQIIEQTKDIGIDSDYADGVALYLGDDGDTFYDQDVDGAREFLMNLWELDDSEVTQLHEAQTLKDFAQVCADRDDIRYGYTSYRQSERFTGFFLTKDAADQHIQYNGYHYSHPMTYAQAAGWRNPELEHLLTIIEKFATPGDKAR